VWLCLCVSGCVWVFVCVCTFVFVCVRVCIQRLIYQLVVRNSSMIMIKVCDV
jgi:hypothetical protein